MQFLRGLNDQFINVRSQILMMDPLPIIYKTFSYIVQQERHIMGMNHIGNLDSKDIMINAASSTSNHRCSFCGKAGHTEDICYRKHGFPSSSKRRGGLGSNNMSGYGRGTDIGMSGRGTDIGMSGRGTKLCTHCDRYGHTVEISYRKHGFPPGHPSHKTNQGATINNTIVEENSKHDTDLTLNTANHDVQFTPQQYQSLLDLIQKPSDGNSTSPSPHINQINSHPVIGNIAFFAICNINKKNCNIMDIRFWCI